MDIAAAVLVVALVGLWLYRRGEGFKRTLEHEHRQALERAKTDAASAERERIFADLHDDLGAKLLQIVYTTQGTPSADLARAALQDLRDVVSRSRGALGDLPAVLADIRQETEQRLRAASIGLDWQETNPIPARALDRAQALHLYRIVREAVSNVIRHASARTLKVRLKTSESQLLLDLSDDGIGMAAPGEGRGTHTMQTRAKELAGDIAWRDASIGGTRVVLTVPLG
jgi:signal transduction histidine kinase